MEMIDYTRALNMIQSEEISAVYFLVLHIDTEEFDDALLVRKILHEEILSYEQLVDPNNPKEKLWKCGRYATTVFYSTTDCDWDKLDRITSLHLNNIIQRVNYEYESSFEWSVSYNTIILCLSP